MIRFELERGGNVGTRNCGKRGQKKTCPTKQSKTQLPTPRQKQIRKHTQRKRKPPPSHRKSNPRKLHPDRNHRKNNPQNRISPHQYSQKQSNAIKRLSYVGGRKSHGL